MLYFRKLRRLLCRRKVRAKARAGNLNRDRLSVTDIDSHSNSPVRLTNIFDSAVYT